MKKIITGVVFVLASSLALAESAIDEFEYFTDNSSMVQSTLDKPLGEVMNDSEDSRWTYTPVDH